MGFFDSFRFLKDLLQAAVTEYWYISTEFSMLLDFKFLLCFLCMLFWVFPRRQVVLSTFRNPLSGPSSKARCGVDVEPLKMDLTEDSETSVKQSDAGEIPKRTYTKLSMLISDVSIAHSVTSRFSISLILK
jgi:hypothetical protein